MPHKLVAAVTGTIVLSTGAPQAYRIANAAPTMPRVLEEDPSVAEARARVAIIMGSASDWDVMKSAEQMLDELGIASDARVISAHRTPERLTRFLATAETDGIEVIIAGAGMAAHLAGVTAAHTILPVLGVPLPGGELRGFDALLATVQMPGGIPVATFAIGKAGAKNAALFAAAILARSDDAILDRLAKFREAQSAAVPERPPRD